MNRNIQRFNLELLNPLIFNFPRILAQNNILKLLLNLKNILIIVFNNQVSFGGSVRCLLENRRIKHRKILRSMFNFRHRKLSSRALFRIKFFNRSPKSSK
uniref:Uncharacterized protein n=1 Tax=Caulerpa verticillata TaxID=177082 RepID=A0A386B0C9_9CHLO|nr:hypothetical protein [Caulerpa verticillata]AYC65158.1 hypothetical protein [Caulerpa verticillata]